AESVGIGHLSVSGAGVRPYRADVTVTSLPGPSLRATGAVQVVDSGPGTSGNGNGVLEAGETAQVRFELENTGTMQADGATVQAFCTEPALMINSSPAMAGTILPGARVWSAPVATTIAMGALDQQRVRLDLTLRTTLGSAWNDRIDLDLL